MTITPWFCPWCIRDNKITFLLRDGEWFYCPDCQARNSEMLVADIYTDLLAKDQCARNDRREARGKAA